MLINQIDELNMDYLIIDEFSMVCNSLLAKVLRTIHADITRKRVKLVLVGDYEQLPPIEPGNLMGELLASTGPRSASGNIAVTKLEVDCRRTKTGPLHNNMRCIAEKRFEELNWADDCMYCEGGIDYVENMVGAYIKACKKLGMELREISTIITVICPYNATCDELNLRIRKLFNIDSAACIADSYGNTWYVGDRIMMTDNRYDINVMNGEEGVVIGIGNGYLRCEFPAGEVRNSYFSYQNHGG